jgi:hypothetical protein
MGPGTAARETAPIVDRGASNAAAIAAQLLEAELEGRPAEGASSYALDRD